MSLIFNKYVILFLTIVLGGLAGKLKFKNIVVGSGFTLIFGIFLSYLLTIIAGLIPETSIVFSAANNYLSNGLNYDEINSIFLMLFITAVGLLAGKSLLTVLKKYGIKFIALALLITSCGAMLVSVSANAVNKIPSRQVLGVYTGALTSTSGLAASLEAVSDSANQEINTFNSLSKEQQDYIVSIVDKPDENGIFSEKQIYNYISEAQKNVSVGHTISYPFGVIIVMIAINFIPIIFKIDKKKEYLAYTKELEEQTQKKGSTVNITNQPIFFDLSIFFALTTIGYLLGQIKVCLPVIGYISLGSTGGILIIALICSSIGRIGKISFIMDEKLLNAIKDIGVGFILATIGIKYGPSVVNAFGNSGIILIGISLFVGILPMMIGFFVGRYVFKMNWFILSGAICGGMTSTPGLGVAIDSVGNNAPAVGYGATYPFATIFMVIFSMIIEKLA